MGVVVTSVKVEVGKLSIDKSYTTTSHFSSSFISRSNGNRYHAFCSIIMSNKTTASIYNLIHINVY